MKKPEQPILNNPENLPDYKKRADKKTYVWLKSQSSEKPPEENSKIENLKGDIMASYPPEEKPFSANKLKVNTPEANRPIAIYPKEETSILKKVLRFLGRNKKKIALTGIATGISIASMASSKSTEGDPTDSLRNSDIKKIESLINKNSERVEIKIANYFQTDKAEISKENEVEISNLVSTYINNLNSKNVEKFINSTPELNVSCDPRNTNSYENGNLGLAKARAEETQRVIKEILSKFNFSKTDLTPDQIKNVIKTFSNLKFNIPESGVIDYHKVINPETNKVFTDSEWTEIQKNKDKLLEVYKTMRFVNLDLVVLLDKDTKEEKPPINKIETGGKPFDFEGYKKVMLLVDKSPSMESHKKELIKNLLDNTKANIETSVIGYTNKIDAAFKSNNLEGAANTIRDMEFINQDVELAVDATIQALEKSEVSPEKGVACIITDEELQGVSKEKLDKLDSLSKTKNFDLRFTVMIRGYIYKLNLDQIKLAFEEKFKEINQQQYIDNQARQIKVLNKILRDQKAELQAGNNNRSYLNKLKKSITETELDILNGEERLKRLAEIKIDNFASVENKNIQQIGKDYSNVPNTVTYPGNDITKNK